MNATIIVEKIIALSDALSACPSLAPGPRVDGLFNELVAIVEENRETVTTIFADAEVVSRIPVLQRLSATGEGLLEFAWAQKVCASENPLQTLLKFPFYENYRLLTERELAVLIAPHMPVCQRLLFVGGGPLPLSALLLVSSHKDVQITCLDNDPAATTLAQQVVVACGVADRVRCVTGTVNTLSGVADYTHITIAALAGTMSGEKEMLVHALATTCVPGTPILLRGVEALGVLLYPTLPLAIRCDLDLLRQVPSGGGVINTIELGVVRATSNHVTEAQWQLVRTLLGQYQKYRASTSVDEKRVIGDAMFYDDPVVWMLYKALAYRLTPHAINTLGDLRQHASDETDICGRRWRFICEYVLHNRQINLLDSVLFPGSLPLLQFADSTLCESLVQDAVCINEWRRQEYYTTKNGVVEKWPQG